MADEDRASKGRSPGSDPYLFARRAFVAAGVVLSVGLLAFAGIRAADGLLLFFGGLLLAIFLRSIVNPLARHTPLSEGVALALTVVVLLAIAAAGGWLLVREVTGEVEDFRGRLPELAGDLQDLLGGTEWGQWVLAEMEAFGGNGDGEEMLAAASSLVQRSLQGVTYLFVIAFVGLYLSVAPQLYVGGIVRLFPIDKRGEVRGVLMSVGKTLQRWLIARAISMAAVGLLTGVGLAIIGVPMAMALGTLAGFLTFVPYLGPLAAGIPIVAVALLEEPSLAVVALVFYTFVQSTEGFIITPVAQHKVAFTPAALVLMSEVVMGLLFGMLGIVLATPLAAAAVVLVKTAWVENALGDREARARA